MSDVDRTALRGDGGSGKDDIVHRLDKRLQELTALLMQRHREGFVELADSLASDRALMKDAADEIERLRGSTF
jgi:hypothetical protein